MKITRLGMESFYISEGLSRITEVTAKGVFLIRGVLYAVKSKRRTSPRMRQGFVENSTPLIKGSSTVSVADILEVVNDDFSDVLVWMC